MTRTVTNNFQAMVINQSINNALAFGNTWLGFGSGLTRLGRSVSPSALAFVGLNLAPNEHVSKIRVTKASCLSTMCCRGFENTSTDVTREENV